MLRQLLVVGRGGGGRVAHLPHESCRARPFEGAAGQRVLESREIAVSVRVACGLEQQPLRRLTCKPLRGGAMRRNLAAELASTPGKALALALALAPHVALNERLTSAW